MNMRNYDLNRFQFHSGTNFKRQLHVWSFKWDFRPFIRSFHSQQKQPKILFLIQSTSNNFRFVSENWCKHNSLSHFGQMLPSKIIK